MFFFQDSKWLKTKVKHVPKSRSKARIPITLRLLKMAVCLSVSGNHWLIAAFPGPEIARRTLAYLVTRLRRSWDCLIYKILQLVYFKYSILTNHGHIISLILPNFVVLYPFSETQCLSLTGTHRTIHTHCHWSGSPLSLVNDEWCTICTVHCCVSCQTLTLTEKKTGLGLGGSVIESHR